jgi:hypothetical protein
MHSKYATQIEKPESQIEEGSHKITKLRSFARKHWADFLRGGVFVGESIALGWFDSTDPMSNPYVAYICNGTANLLSKAPGALITQIGLTNGNNVYQLGLLTASFTLAGAALYHPVWGKLRNSFNLTLGVTSAVIADFISEWFTKPAGQPPLPIPNGDIQWRIHAFLHSSLLAPLAHWVNNRQNSIIPGAIQGWNAGIEIFAGWAALQFGMAYKKEIVQFVRGSTNKIKEWGIYTMLITNSILEFIPK